MKKILLAEDNTVFAGLIVTSMMEEGYSIVWVDNGSKAWDLLTQGQEFDLVMSDHEMPEMSGAELLRRARMDDCIAKMPFILMSGGLVVSKDDQTPLEVICRRFKATFVEKPFFGFEELVAEIFSAI